MENRGRFIQSSEQFDAPDAEEDFLLNARGAVAAITPQSEIAVLRRVFREIGIQ